jgi:UDP-glucuronate decarboxylase
MESRILLTGGTGFFGRALLRNLLSCGMDKKISIWVLSRNPKQFQAAHPDLAISNQIRFFQADIQDRESLPWNHSFTHILHAATDSTVGPQLTPLQRFNQIVEGTTNILDLTVKTGAHRFLLTSSGGVYGPQPTDLEAIPEDWHGSPPLDQASTAYSQGKRAAEHLCALYRDEYGLETVVARCFAFVGPDLPLDAHFAIGNFIHDAISSDAITVVGDGTPLRTYLDQSDLAQWLWTLLMEGIDGEAYNIGSERKITIADLAHLVRDLIAPTKRIRILGEPQPSALRSRYVPSTNKIQTLHGLRAKISLEQAIIRTANN